jgi:tRNA A-37 threonylcarbamoyl transferase component Bud32
MAAVREYRTLYTGTSDVTLHEIDCPTIDANVESTIDEERPERRYALGDVLGSGGMGEVRAARDLRVGRDVAVKTIHREHAEPHIVARFVREARIQARLDHPAIVPVFDLDVDEHGTPFFAMKRLTGVSLHSVLLDRYAQGDASGWTRRELLARLIDVCQAIQLAHDRGVVHRDLKPGNIVLGEYGEVYVIDWGIARMIGEVDVADDEITNDSSLLEAVPPTLAGQVFGTPGYMAPEQLRGEPVDPRTDVYGLGCVLFEVLTLRAALPAVVDRVATEPLSPAACSPDLDIPPELDAVVRHATMPDRHARLGTTREIADALTRYLDGDRDLQQRRDLARRRMAIAQHALRTDPDGRRHALREAGRALALDPGNSEAQAFVGHLLLAPVDTVPAEVDREIERAQVRTSQDQLRLGTAVYAGYFAMIMTVWASGGRSGWLLAVAAGVALNMIMLGVAALRERPVGRLIYPALVVTCGTIVLAGVVLGPFLIVPPIVIGAVGGFLSQPSTERLAPTIAAHIACVIAPFALELTGITPRTFSFDASGLHVHLWAVHLSPLAIVVMVVGVTIGQLAATAAMVIQLRRAKSRAEHALQIQLWHLRHLVPDVSGARISEPRAPRAPVREPSFDRSSRRHDAAATTRR